MFYLKLLKYKYLPLFGKIHPLLVRLSTLPDMPLKACCLALL